MSKPATEMRLARAAEGFTQVIARGDSHIITKNPTTGKCAYDGQVGGGWHYNGDQETDTAFVPGTAPWNWQMVKANYNVFALSQFNQGQIIKWLDPGSGQSIAFQPMALQWTNNLNQIQQISMPQAVAAQASDDILYWPAAYGSGRNFRYQASPLRLNKQLIIDSPSALPATTYDTLELNFVISVSSGVNIMVNGAAWNKKSTKDTVNSIAFQLPGGAVLWSFAEPTAYDSSGTIEGSITGSMRLKKQGNSLYVSIRFPKSFFDNAAVGDGQGHDYYPVCVDPTVEYQTGAGADDGMWEMPSWFSNSGGISYMGPTDTAAYTLFSRWSSVTIPAGSTIDVAYVSFYFFDYGGTPAECDLYFVDEANPTAISSASNGNGRTLTSNSIKITSPTAGTWWNSNSIVSIIQELVDSNSYASGAAMEVVVIPPAPNDNLRYGRQRTYEFGGSGAKLHIEYTEASPGSLIGGKLLRGGLLLHGILGR